MDFSDSVSVNDDRQKARRYSKQWRGSRATAVLVYLPAEITDIIISYVDDGGTLCRCMLVCRAWTPASRANLFEEIAIEKSSSYTTCLCNGSFIPMRSRRISPPHAFSGSIPTNRTTSAYSHRVFHDIAGHLPGLRTPTLANFNWGKTQSSC
ncbi:hypothetical protein C8T65DRAFT_255766 [Cerioporus squamosus]|nr:hypothetical protein C8T65DRAFT_255766 [Cerioporus squamosus]